MITVYVSKDLECRYVKEMPEEPVAKHSGSLMDDSYLIAEDAQVFRDYKTALWNAKQVSIPFEDQILVIKKILNSLNISTDTYGLEDLTRLYIKPDTFYQIQGEVKIAEVFSHCTRDEKHYQTVARLIESNSKEGVRNSLNSQGLDSPDGLLNSKEVTPEEKPDFQKHAKYLMELFSKTSAKVPGHPLRVACLDHYDLKNALEYFWNAKVLPLQSRISDLEKENTELKGKAG